MGDRTKTLGIQMNALVSMENFKGSGHMGDKGTDWRIYQSGSLGK
jgi:hypothetical protein